MIPSMTPISAMPSSTRLTPTFTPNAKSIVGKNTPALKQRQGFDNGTLIQLDKERDSLLQFLRLYIDRSRPYTPSELFEKVNKLEEKVIFIIATLKNELTPSDSLLKKHGLKRTYNSFMNEFGQRPTAEVDRRLAGQIESYEEILDYIRSAGYLIREAKKLNSNRDITPNDAKSEWSALRALVKEQVRRESLFRSFIRVMFG